MAADATRRRDLVVATAGLAFYWPFFTHPVYPPELLAGIASLTPALFLSLFLIACIACALGIALAGRRIAPHAPACPFLRVLAPGASVVYAVLLALAATSQGTIPLALAGWASPFVLGVLMAALTARWASVTSSFGTGSLALVLTASLAFSTIVSVAAQDIGALFGVTEATSTQVLPLVSAWACCLAPRSPKERPIPDGSGTAPTAPVTGSEASPAGTRSAGRRWLVMVGSLFLFLFGSGVFRSAFTSHAGYTGVTQDWLHRVILLAFAALLVAWAWLAMRRRMQEPYPWVAFLVVCLVALYCGVVFYPLFASLANEIMLPTRPVAIVLMWAATERFAREAGRSPIVATACLFLPLETLTRVATSWLGDGFWASPTSQLFLEATMLVTALALTLGVIAWLLLGMRGAQGEQATAGAPPQGSPDDSIAALRDAHGLSEREAEVMALLSRGYTQKRIAEELSVSVNSVQTYAKTLYRKLGVHSRQEIIDLVAGGR